MWMTSWFMELVGMSGLHFIDYDACMHGGQRKKAQRLLSNWGSLSSLAVRCSNDHEHLPWVVAQAGRKYFMTGEEAVYPYVFVERVAAKLAGNVDAKNGDGDRSKVYELKLRLAAVRRANAAAAGRQSRHKGGPTCS